MSQQTKTPLTHHQSQLVSPTVRDWRRSPVMSQKFGFITPSAGLTQLMGASSRDVRNLRNYFMFTHSVLLYHMGYCNPTNSGFRIQDFSAYFLCFDHLCLTFYFPFSFSFPFLPNCGGYFFIFFLILHLYVYSKPKKTHTYTLCV